MENVNFILKFIPSSYIKNLLEIVIEKSSPKITRPMGQSVNLNSTGRDLENWKTLKSILRLFHSWE